MSDLTLKFKRKTTLCALQTSTTAFHPQTTDRDRKGTPRPKTIRSITLATCPVFSTVTEEHLTTEFRLYLVVAEIKLVLARKTTQDKTCNKQKPTFPFWS